MVKTIQISDDVHTMVAEKQLELIKKKINRKFVEIADQAIKNGIDSVK